MKEKCQNQQIRRHQIFFWRIWHISCFRARALVESRYEGDEKVRRNLIPNTHLLLIIWTIAWKLSDCKLVKPKESRVRLMFMNVSAHLHLPAVFTISYTQVQLMSCWAQNENGKIRKTSMKSFFLFLKLSPVWRRKETSFVWRRIIGPFSGNVLNFRASRKAFKASTIDSTRPIHLPPLRAHFSQFLCFATFDSHPRSPSTLHSINVVCCMPSRVFCKGAWNFSWKFFWRFSQTTLLQIRSNTNNLKD